MRVSYSVCVDRHGVASIHYVSSYFFRRVCCRDIVNYAFGYAVGRRVVSVYFVALVSYVERSELGVFHRSLFAWGAQHYDILCRVSTYSILQGFVSRYACSRHYGRH